MRIFLAASILLIAPGKPAMAAERAATSVQSHLVRASVTVTDRNGKSVTDLKREHFQVLDNSEPREIVSFSREDGPASVGVVLDLSGSISPCAKPDQEKKNKLRRAASAARAITEEAEPGDDAFLNAIAAPLLGATAHGYTALMDAVYKAMDEVRSISNQRKALMVISDGGDTYSRYSESELKRRAIEADADLCH